MAEFKIRKNIMNYTAVLYVFNFPFIQLIKNFTANKVYLIFQKYLTTHWVIFLSTF